MKKLNKKNSANNMNMEAFGFFGMCYCSCGCEKKAATRGVGQMYFSQDSNSVSNKMDFLGLYGAYDYVTQGNYVK